MIIDLILDRKFYDDTAPNGFGFGFVLSEIRYKPEKFYRDVFRYIDGCGDEYAQRITRAMDTGTEEDVRRELCAYVMENGYNPEICDYINSRDWIKEENG